MHYHVLNGDALLQQFPKEIHGTKIVARECLVTGPVQGESWFDVLDNRRDYMQSSFNTTQGEYNTETVLEFSKIAKIPAGSQVYLWFEEDLFCQVNWWFCVFLIGQLDKNLSCFLVKPIPEYRYGFAGMNTDELALAFKNAETVNKADSKTLALLWRAYQEHDFTTQEILAKKLAANFPFVAPAVAANIARFPKDDILGRPEQIIQDIIGSLNTTHFPIVFREFCNRAPIYGFGDLQVKLLLDAYLEQMES